MSKKERLLVTSLFENVIRESNEVRRQPWYFARQVHIIPTRNLALLESVLRVVLIPKIVWAYVTGVDDRINMPIEIYLGVSASRMLMRLRTHKDIDVSTRDLGLLSPKRAQDSGQPGRKRSTISCDLKPRNQIKNGFFNWKRIDNQFKLCEIVATTPNFTSENVTNVKTDVRNSMKYRKTVKTKRDSRSRTNKETTNENNFE